MASDRIRFLQVSPALTDALLLLRSRKRKPPRPILEAEVVEAVERSIEAPLPDELLAYFAAASLDLRTVAALTDEARAEGLDEDRVAFAKSPTGIYCLITRDDGTVGVGDWSEDGPEPMMDQTLAAFVRRHHDLVTPEPHELAALAKAKETFAPCVAKKAPQRPSRVSHPKFGEGQVVQEIQDGSHKLVVDFSSGRKTVMARFVSVVELEAAS
ncbi:MAG: hypothetical protein H6719_06210 [Sandaracinaceae bacterium]|nr:hypothetical protein [Sandaracinaceae bacterium]